MVYWTPTAVRILITKLLGTKTLKLETQTLNLLTNLTPCSRMATPRTLLQVCRSAYEYIHRYIHISLGVLVGWNITIVAAEDDWRQKGV
jgi:hypothetical protein